MPYEVDTSSRVENALFKDLMKKNSFNSLLERSSYASCPLSNGSLSQT